MAKTPPATAERFRIHAESSMEHMGFVLAELTKLGLQNVGYELITDVVTFRKNGARKASAAPASPVPKKRLRREIKNKDVILKRIKGRASFTLKELRDHFMNIGRNPVSISPLVDQMLKANLVTRLDAGVYAWGKVKKKKAAKKTVVAVKKKRDEPVT